MLWIILRGEWNWVAGFYCYYCVFVIWEAFGLLFERWVINGKQPEREAAPFGRSKIFSSVIIIIKCHRNALHVLSQLLYNHSFILHRENSTRISSELILCFIAVSSKESENEQLYFVLNTTILLDCLLSFSLPHSTDKTTNFNLFMKVVNYELRSQTQTNTWKLFVSYMRRLFSFDNITFCGKQPLKIV